MIVLAKLNVVGTSWLCIGSDMSLLTVLYVIRKNHVLFLRIQQRIHRLSINLSPSQEESAIYPSNFSLNFQAFADIGFNLHL